VVVLRTVHCQVSIGVVVFAGGTVVGRVVVMGGIAVGRIVVQLPQGFSVLIDSAFAAEISVSKVMMASF
jgi:hypothetical protein